MKFQGVTSPVRLPVWLGVGAVVLLAGEAALQATWPWLGLATVAAAAFVVPAWQQRGNEGKALSLGLAALAALLGVATWRTGTATLQPGQVARAAVDDAVAARDRLLRSAVAAANRSARLALSRVGNTPLGTPHSFVDLLSGSDPEAAITVLGGDTVLAVAGPHRLAPHHRVAPFTIATTPFARLLVVQVSQGGRDGQVTLLLDASPGVPVAGASLADDAGGWQEVSWDWDRLPAELAFPTADSVSRTLARVMHPVAPDPSDFRVREARLARWLTGIGLVILALVILLTASHPAARAGAMLVPLWALIRSDVDTGALGLGVIKALLAAVALFLVASLLWRRPVRRSVMGLTAAMLLLGTAPPLVDALAHQVVPQFDTGSLPALFGWELAVALAAAGLFAVATAPLRTPTDAEAPGWRGWVAIGAIVVVGVVGVVAWNPRPSGWAHWYIPCWLVPLALLLPEMPARVRRLAVATAAGTLAALATWGASLDRQVTLAGEDLGRLAASSDTVATRALDAFAGELKRERPTRLDDLYAAWRTSALESAGIPTHLAVFNALGQVRENVALDQLAVTWDDLIPMVKVGGDTARRAGFARGFGHHEVLVLPIAPDTIVSVAVGPRSRIIAPSRFGRLVGWRSPAEPLYTESVLPIAAEPTDGVFRRANRFVRASLVVRSGDAPRIVRAEIEMSRPEPYAVRGLLTVLLDIGTILALWFMIERWLGAGIAVPTDVLRRSYRRTLATTLAAFFIVPALSFTLWLAIWLRQDATKERGIEVAQTLGEVVDVGDGFGLTGPGLPGREALGRRVDSALARTADSVDASIAIYRGARLQGASSPMLVELGILPPVLDPATRPPEGDVGVTLAGSFPDIGVRLGVEATPPPGTLVVAALPGGNSDLAREQVDLALFLLLAIVGGSASAVAVAGTVARALGRPIETLRRTALAIGRRETVPKAVEVPAEFEPVFGAIRQMEADLRASVAELEAGRQRTTAILSTVATGVIGVDAAGLLMHANPRARELLGTAFEVGAPLRGQFPPAWREVEEAIDRLLGRGTRTPESREVEVGERRFSMTLAPLGDGGLVVAITDITEAARAARVLAWGEMARQVAHEIKNPLTPMRLGLQHLRRVRADGNPEYPALVEATSERLLAEIDRLDRIARSFARYGAPPSSEPLPLEGLDLRAAVDEIVGLYRLSAERPSLVVEGNGGGAVLGRREELVQVLLNLLDNARQAGAGQVRLVLGDGSLAVSDDGAGIPADQLGRIFEPAFSTTTSGTGLGLAIVRRLVEGWGATIGVDSPEGGGATFTIRFATSPASTPGGGRA